MVEQGIAPKRLPDPDRLTLRDSALARGEFRQGRIWRVAFVPALVVGCFSMGHFAGAVQKEEEILKAKRILAESFELRDQDDELSASLSRSARGETLLTFYDKAKQPRLSMGLDEKGLPGISFFGEKNKVSMKWSTSAGEDAPSLCLYDGHGDPAISLGIAEKSGPCFRIGSPGKPQISIAVTREGSPSIQLFDTDNKSRVEISLQADLPVIALRDEKQTLRATWRLQAGGTPVMSFSDANARPRLVLMTDQEGRPSIQFIDANRKLIREVK